MSDLNFKNQSIHKVSVVIPTLGGESLGQTIKQLNRGTIVPAEILICIPIEDAYKTETLLFPNVRIVKTISRGQVVQRAIGFQNAQNSLVLQLDDDILVEEHCLEYLIELIIKEKNLAVGPSLFDNSTGEYHSFLTLTNPKQTLFEFIFYWIINGSQGYQPGQLGISGVNMGIPENPPDWTNIKWLPGCCVLHRKNNLILYDYYPYKGKAFAEDLFHSKILTKNGIRMIRCGKAQCFVDFSSGLYKDFKGFKKDYGAYKRAITRFAKDYKFSLIRLNLYLIFNLFRLASRKFLSLF